MLKIAPLAAVGRKALKWSESSPALMERPIFTMRPGRACPLMAFTGSQTVAWLRCVVAGFALEVLQKWAGKRRRVTKLLEATRRVWWSTWSPAGGSLCLGPPCTLAKLATPQTNQPDTQIFEAFRAADFSKLRLGSNLIHGF